MIDINAIKEALPHRYPMLLVDRVLEVSEDEIVALKNVTINERFFQGHFPGEPVMPGVLIVECLAQAGSISLLMLDELKGKHGYLGGVDKVRFRQKVVPGDVLRLEVEINKLRRNIGTATGTAWVEDKRVCTCEMTFIIGAD